MTTAHTTTYSCNKLTLLTFCPPAPLALAVRISTSAIFSILSSLPVALGSASGTTATVAVLVCTRPDASVAGTRWTRCTPACSVIIICYIVRGYN